MSVTLLLPLGATIIGFGVSTIVFTVYSATKLFGLGIATGCSAAIVLGFLSPALEAAVPFTHFFALDVWTLRPVTFVASLEGVQVASIMGGITAAFCGSMLALVPGCVIRFACCQSEQGWWLAFTIYGVFGALMGAAVGGGILSTWLNLY
jgi:hypothetical protein